MNNNNYYRSMMKTEPGTRESHSTSVEGVWFINIKIMEAKVTMSLIASSNLVPN
jgi:hypothetical protein